MTAASRQTIPGGVYLCQPHKNISCGACCGLYNVKGASFKTLHDMLEKRTLEFQHIKRNVAELDAFGESAYNEDITHRPYPHFHHCPYLGLVGENTDLVGCLLHPLADGNNGTDWRGLSYYGGLACRTYFCPTHNKTPAVYKKAVQKTVIRAAANGEKKEGWYVYGHIITESDLINHIFAHIEDKAGKMIEENDLKNNNEFIDNLYPLITLKLSLSFRPNGVLPHYFFNDGMYDKRNIDFSGKGMAKSPYDDILRQLNGDFSTPGLLKKAREEIETLIEKAADALLNPKACGSFLKPKVKTIPPPAGSCDRLRRKNQKIKSKH